MAPISLHDVVLVLSIGLLDSILSVDNALINAALARQLPQSKQHQAVVLGLGFGAILRIGALFIAQFILRFPVIKVAGAFWLLWLAYQFFSKRSEERLGTNIQEKTLLSVLGAIGFADLAFSIDNIIASVGLTARIGIIVAGVIVSILVMMVATQVMIKLMHRYTLLEGAAYGVIAFIGVAMLLSDAYHLVSFLPHYEIPTLIKVTVTLGVLVCTVVFEELRRLQKAA